MDMTLYQELGLSPNEAKIYHALLTYGGSGVSTIALRAKVHRRNAYDALQRLLHKGLVMEIYSRSETVYEAVEPGKLMELLHEKQMNLESHMPQLRDMYMAKRAAEQAYIYKGVEGVKNYLREALKSGEDMYLLGAEGAWLDPRLKTYTLHFLESARKKGMKIYCLFEDDCKEIPEAPKLIADEYKFFPAEYDTQSTMDIFGDYVVTYTGTFPGKLTDDTTIFVMHSPKLAESYRVWWKLLWDTLPEKSKKVRHTSKKKKSQKSRQSNNH